MNSIKIAFALLLDKICGVFTPTKSIEQFVAPKSPAPKTKAKKTTKKSEKKTK